MKYYEYDNQGWLVGWHTDANRPNSTMIEYEPIEPNLARWVNDAWVRDTSREAAITLEFMRAKAVVIVQERLDNLAKSWGYDNILSLCSYAGSKKNKFAAEGRIGMDWRDDTWSVVDANQNSVTSIEELIALLPAIPTRP